MEAGKGGERSASAPRPSPPSIQEQMVFLVLLTRADAGSQTERPGVLLMKMKIIATCILALACGACVSTPEHEALRKELRQVKEEWARAELLKQHHIHVIMILQYMPEDAHKYLSLDKMGLHGDGRIDLRPMAKADLEAGRIQFLDAGGYPHPWLPHFEKMMKEKYGVTYVGFGLGCVTDEAVRESVAEYNAVVDDFVRKEHPAFDRQKEFETFVQEWEQKQGAEQTPAGDVLKAAPEE